jgi:hypothetical protein
MPDPLDPIAIVLRLVGAFYAFAGVVAARAGLMSALMDTALAGITLKKVSFRERALSWWLLASAWLVFASGALLMVLAREAMWAFILCALTQAFYLWIAAPYYFDAEDPPDAAGRRQTTNAFFIYMGVTMLVIWASGSVLTPIVDLSPVIQSVAAVALAGFAAFVIWQSVSATRAPATFPSYDDFGGDDANDQTSRKFDPRMPRLELARDGGPSPVRNQRTGAWVALDSLALSDDLRIDLDAWHREGDPQMEGKAQDLAERLARELTGYAVAVPGILHEYFGFAASSPYADPDTGAPNWDRMTAVKIMADYQCLPVWAANGGAVGDLPPHTLGLSAALEDALLDWQDAFDSSLNLDNPAVPHWTPEQFATHEAEGLALAARVKAERPEMTIYAHSSRGVLIADPAAPPDVWKTLQS